MASTLKASLDVLRGLAVGLEDEEPRPAARRLLERAAAREDAEELRAALTELGAVAIFDPVGALSDFDGE